MQYDHPHHCSCLTQPKPHHSPIQRKYDSPPPVDPLLSPQVLHQPIVTSRIFFHHFSILLTPLPSSCCLIDWAWCEFSIVSTQITPSGSQSATVPTQKIIPFWIFLSFYLVYNLESHIKATNCLFHYICLCHETVNPWTSYQKISLQLYQHALSRILRHPSSSFRHYPSTVWVLLLPTRPALRPRSPSNSNQPSQLSWNYPGPVFIVTNFHDLDFIRLIKDITRICQGNVKDIPNSSPHFPSLHKPINFSLKVVCYQLNIINLTNSFLLCMTLPDSSTQISTFQPLYHIPLVIWSSSTF